MAINQFQGLPAGITGIAQALDMLGSVYKMKQAGAARDLLEQEIAANRAQAEMLGQQRDVNSPISVRAQKEHSALLDAIKQGGYKGAEGLKGAISGASAYDLSNDSALKSYMEYVKGEQGAKAMVARTAPQWGKLDEIKNQNSVDAGNDFEKDPIILNSKTNLNSLKRSKTILENPDVPVTAKDLNLAFNDYMNATAPGGAATEGKVNRELPDTFAQDLNDMRVKLGKKGDSIDLRQNPTGANLINMLSQHMTGVSNDLQNQISDQAFNKFQSYQATTNDQVKAIAKQKLKDYSPDRYSTLFGGGNPKSAVSPRPAPVPTNPLPNPQPTVPAGGGGIFEGSAQADQVKDPDAMKYSAMHKIPYEQAATIVATRKAAMNGTKPAQ